MKKVMVLLLSWILLCSSLFSCQQVPSDIGGNTGKEPTEDTTETEEGSEKLPVDGDLPQGFPPRTVWTKEGVEEFVELARNTSPEISSVVKDNYEETLYNITPHEVKTRSDIQLFYFTDNGDVYGMVADKEVFRLPPQIYFRSAIPCDFDQDGNMDLLISSTTGSGMTSETLYHFNTVTKENTVIYHERHSWVQGVGSIVRRYEIAYDIMECELYLSNFSTKTDAEGYYVYPANVVGYDPQDRFHSFYLERLLEPAPMGYITQENGKIVFKLYKD